MQTIDTVAAAAAERVSKARQELILERTFYGVLVSQVEPVASRDFPTMATDGRRHFFNPEFISGLKQIEVLGVQAHETEHDARRHHTRRGNRDPQEWNVCCDLAINPDLIRAGFTLPKGMLLDWRFEGMSAEDIYRTRELERQKPQEPPPPPQDGEDGEADDASKHPVTKMVRPATKVATTGLARALVSRATSRATRARARVTATLATLARPMARALATARPARPAKARAQVRRKAAAMPTSRSLRPAIPAAAARCSTRHPMPPSGPTRTPDGTASCGRPQASPASVATRPATSPARSSAMTIRRKIGARPCAPFSTAAR
jgi:hypothetical protein